jgi:hypothetical protein
LAATGQVADVDPEAFKIIEGKLYLNWNMEVSNLFSKKGEDAIKKADESWTNLNE